jgi:anti-sigma factor RsiW
MNECPYRPRIGPYYDGEVDAGERQQIAAHLAGCASCQQELAGLQRLSAQLATMNTPALSTAFMGQLHQQVDVQENNNLRRVARIFLAAAACLFIGMALWLFQTRAASHEPVTPWEAAASDPQAVSTSNSNTDVALAHWMVRDLSRSSGDE